MSRGAFLYLVAVPFVLSSVLVVGAWVFLEEMSLVKALGSYVFLHILFALTMFGKGIITNP